MQVIIKCHNGQTITLDVECNYSIASVKEKIHTTLQIKPNDQRLFLNGILLKDDTTLAACDIKDQSIIDLIPFLYQGMLIFIRVIEGRTIPIEIDTNDSIRTIKFRILKKLEIKTIKQRLIYNKIVLQDDHTLAMCNIKNEDSIEMIKLQYMQIFISDKDGKKYPFEAEINDSIASLKNKIDATLKIKPNEQRLFFYGSLLKDDSTIDGYNIKDQSIIDLIPVSYQGMQIFIQNNEGKPFSIEVESNESIKIIKEKIFKTSGIKPKEQRLIKDKMVLRDDQTLNMLHIRNEESIYMMKFSCIQILIHNIDGKTYPFEAESNDLIAIFKTKICPILNITPNEQELFFYGKQLIDNATLDDCEIKDQSIINHIPVNYPGMYIFILSNEEKSFPVPVESNDSIKILKEKIFKTTGIKTEEQRLIYNRNALQDDKTLAMHYIKNKDSICLTKFSCIQIFIHNIDGKFYPFEAENNDSIEIIKNKIHKTLKIKPNDQKLFFYGNLLKDDATLAACEIKDQSIIKLITVEYPILHIFIRYNCGNIFPFHAESNHSIKTIKEKIYKILKIKPNELSLFYLGTQLKDETILADCDIKDQSIIDLFIDLYPNLYLFIRYKEGKIFLIEAEKYEPIRISIKEKIYNKLGIKLISKHYII